jgi:hypothetical protein
MCETQDVTSNPPFGVKRYYSCPKFIFRAIVRGGHENRKSANSRAYSAIPSFLKVFFILSKFELELFIFCTVLGRRKSMYLGLAEEITRRLDLQSATFSEGAQI